MNICLFKDLNLKIIGPLVNDNFHNFPPCLAAPGNTYYSDVTVGHQGNQSTSLIANSPLKDCTGAAVEVWYLSDFTVMCVFI